MGEYAVLTAGQPAIIKRAIPPMRREGIQAAPDYRLTSDMFESTAPLQIVIRIMP